MGVPSEVALLSSNPDPERLEAKDSNRNCTLVTTVGLPCETARLVVTTPVLPLGCSKLQLE